MDRLVAKTVSLCVALVLTSSFAAAQVAKELGTDPDKLEPLQDEVSRKALFSLIKARRASGSNSMGGSKSQTAQHKLGQGGETEQLNGQVGPFTFPNDAQFDGLATNPRTNSIFGIDISHYADADLPFRQLFTSKVSFVYVKGTQGTKFKDGKFVSFWKALDDLPPDKKVHRGAYHFLTAGQDASGQAATFLKFIEANGGFLPTDMPPVLDLEWKKYTNKSRDAWTGQAPDQILEKARTWLQIVKEETGRVPLLYTSYVWWRERGIPDSALDQLLNDGYGIWIADYSKSDRAVEVPKLPAGTRWALWQFTDSARLPEPYKKGVDATIFKGTEDQFYEKFGLSRFQINSP